MMKWKKVEDVEIDQKSRYLAINEKESILFGDIVNMAKTSWCINGGDSMSNVVSVISENDLIESFKSQSKSFSLEKLEENVRVAAEAYADAKKILNAIEKDSKEWHVASAKEDRAWNILFNAKMEYALKEEE